MYLILITNKFVIPFFTLPILLLIPSFIACECRFCLLNEKLGEGFFYIIIIAIIIIIIIISFTAHHIYLF